MIARSSLNAEPLGWQEELGQAYVRPLELLRDLAIDPAAIDYLPAASAAFQFRVPRAYARRMLPGDPRDPLLLQVIPRAAELANPTGFSVDPVGDGAATRVPGLLQKYSGRALLILTGGCAINCRYCFRREYPYQTAVGQDRLAAAIATIAADHTVDEVILSGGDPLTMRDAGLADLVRALAEIPHVRRLRVHTRIPVVLPSRVTTGLLTALTSRLAAVMVLHANHANEIDGDVIAACAALRASGFTLLNQSVLLRDINDDATTLVALSNRLFDAQVLPYYLHLLDRVAGASQFEVADSRARVLYAELQQRLPGYLVPRLVREVPGAPSKIPFL
jgi:L-lysine 2,3-aminomutase